jgi:hypothetical protein
MPAASIESGSIPSLALLEDHAARWPAPDALSRAEAAVAKEGRAGKGAYAAVKTTLKALGGSIGADDVRRLESEILVLQMEVDHLQAAGDKATSELKALEKQHVRCNGIR